MGLALASTLTTNRAYLTHLATSLRFIYFFNKPIFFQLYFTFASKSQTVRAKSFENYFFGMESILLNHE